MVVYKSKYAQLPGSSYEEVVHLARIEFNTIRKLSKRQPYIRSVYFSKDKIFLTLFWDHLAQKHRGEKLARLKLYVCALDLLRHTTYSPVTILDNTKTDVLLHRFVGISRDSKTFFVQVKHNSRNGRKDFVSVFPKSKNK